MKICLVVLYLLLAYLQTNGLNDKYEKANTGLFTRLHCKCAKKNEQCGACINFFYFGVQLDRYYEEKHINFN
jgi:hypothetical protein